MMADADYKAIDEEERGLLLSRFTPKDAWWLGCALQERASSRNAPVAIEIVKGDRRCFFASLDGATLDNADWTRRKLAVANRFERSSYAMTLFLEEEGYALDLFGLDGKDYVLSGGAVPIRVKDVGIVGAAAISGLAQEEDHFLVVEGIKALRDWQAGGG